MKDFEFSLVFEDGTAQQVVGNATPLWDAQGQLRGSVLVLTDITARKQGEDALRATLQRFYTLLSNLYPGLLLMTEDGRVEFVNQSFCDLYALPPPRDLIGLPSRDLLAMILPAFLEPEEARRRILQILEDGQPVQGEEFFLKNGSTALRDFVPVSVEGKAYGRLWIHIDITERKQAQAELERTAQQRQLALDAAQMGWWHYDPTTRVASWDDRYKEIFGVTGYTRPNDEFLAEIIHPEDLPGLWAKVEAALDPINPQPYSSQYRINRPDGAMRWIEANGIASFEGDGEGRRAVSLVGTVADITERKRAEEALKEADRRKDEFLAMLAHELRNPLAPIRNAVYLLRLIGPAEPRLEQARDMIDRQVSHMVRLIDDLLDVSRITRGKISLRKERLDLAAVVAQAAEVAAPLLSRKRQAFAVSCAPEPIEVEADPARLVQVLANLLNNAAKFTEPGGSITLTTERSGDDAVIRVRDTGVGIAPELLPHIFDLFVQGETSLDRTEGGLGIGLTLVRHVVEQHGGRIEARSAGRGCGSEFVVTWPAAPPAVTVSPHAAFVESAEPGRRLRILVVEDNLDAAESFVMLLQLQGHDIRAAHSGLTALEVAPSFVADVAFIDLGLPGMDGYEVARRLRAIPGFQATVLVALTGYGQEEDKRRSLEAGFDHHLIKPVDPATIDRLLMGIGAPSEGYPHFLH